jgi:DNA-binding transcriptional LysR family regulator
MFRVIIVRMHLPSMEELRAFVAVAEAGGFTAASQRLNLTTNAVSLRIQKLEETMRVRLFVRTTRSVALTEEGEQFLAKISPLLTAIEAAQEEVGGERGGVRGAVRIAIPGALATMPFLTRLNARLHEHPELVVRVRVGSFTTNLAADGFDIAVHVGQVPDTIFVGRRLGTVTWVLAAAPAYLERFGRPKLPADLSKHRCLRLYTHPPQSEWIIVDKRGNETVVPVSGSFEADDSRVLGDATYAGLGIGLRPQGECMRSVASGALERVLPNHKFQPLDITALLPKGRSSIPRIAACLEVLREATEELE